MRIAVPANAAGGLDAKRSDHFVRCDIFTMIECDEPKAITGATTMQNGHHEAGGCMLPVKTLLNAGVETIIVGGIGQGLCAV
jgi:predicted Fe-Mo cluster-binding NifX family protein